MIEIALQGATDLGRVSGFLANQAMALFGGRVPDSNQTRVRTANLQSCSSQPADLDAFLRAYSKAC